MYSRVPATQLASSEREQLWLNTEFSKVFGETEEPRSKLLCARGYKKKKRRTERGSTRNTIWSVMLLSQLKFNLNKICMYASIIADI